MVKILVLLNLKARCTACADDASTAFATAVRAAQPMELRVEWAKTCEHGEKPEPSLFVSPTPYEGEP